MMSTKRVFRFAYYQPPDNVGNVRLHELRDCEAFVEILAALEHRGYNYEDTFLNYPDCGESEVDEERLGMNSSDILVLTTRPPLNDDPNDHQRPVRCSETGLEKKITRKIKKYFEYCSRYEVWLSGSMAEELADENADKAAYKFRLNDSGRVNSRAIYTAHKANSKHSDWLDVRNTNTDLTVVYFLYAREAWAGGPQLVVSFSMGGPENLIWARILRKNYSDLLDKPIFFMGEMKVGGIPTPYTSLAFSERWPVTKILQYEL